MTTCSVRWRPSGGRGEFEFVPADSLHERDISVDFLPLGVRIPAEVRGRHAQGKPRLRKFDSNDRSKLHLPQLVMAVSGLPEPARSETDQSVNFPLESKSFVMDEMVFEIVEDDGLSVVLAPQFVSILHSDFRIQLRDRLDAMVKDLAQIDNVRAFSSELADAIEEHSGEFRKGINSISIRRKADTLIDIKRQLFGQTNAGSATELLRAQASANVEAEEFSAKEGRLLARIHVYRERNRGLVRRAREHYKSVSDGRLACEACGSVPADVYGPQGERCMEAHHKVPIEELQPDSKTSVRDMAMVCANCHRVIHSRAPCLTIQEVEQLLGTRGLPCETD